MVRKLERGLAHAAEVISCSAYRSAIAKGSEMVGNADGRGSRKGEANDMPARWLFRPTRPGVGRG